MVLFALMLCLLLVGSIKKEREKKKKQPGCFFSPGPYILLAVPHRKFMAVR
jgi:hypothetical protein